MAPLGLCSGGRSLAVVPGPLTAVASLVVRTGFSTCHALAQCLLHTGLVALQRALILDQGLNPCPWYWQADS